MPNFIARVVQILASKLMDFAFEWMAFQNAKKKLKIKVKEIAKGSDREEASKRINDLFNK